MNSGNLLLIFRTNLCWILLATLGVQPSFGQSVKVLPPTTYGPVPTAQQLAWHRMECNAFIHFTINTFTGREWGEGNEPESLFQPTALNTNQWAQVLKQAGFKGMILTAKHHDGFCLWPTQTTTHNISRSPYKMGKGDVVKEAATAARKAGLQFGVYLSPWDRNTATYGQPEYPPLYRRQMTELMQQYGSLFEFWMDGANGGNGYYGGANEVRKIDRRTYYQWPTAIALARRLQPETLIFSDAGPDIRWCGNEAGKAGEPNWNTITTDTLYPGFSNSEAILQHGSPTGKQWVPAEVDVSIRPGWFYHTSENDKVKTPEQLFDIYLNSVGRGAVLLLNVPPDTSGQFHPADVVSLHGFKKLLDERLGHNLAARAKATASNWRGHTASFSPALLTDGNPSTYWATDDSTTTGWIEINLEKPTTLHYISLQEYIPLGQRIAAFSVAAWQNGGWQTIAKGTTVGYKRILKMNPLQTEKIRITIDAANACPLLSNVEVY